MSLPPRKSPMRRGGKIRPKKRTASERLRIYGSTSRIAFVQSLPCSCGCGRFPCEVAHVVRGDGGMAYKASARFTAPLFPECHKLLHQCGPATFEALYGIDLAECAARTARAWNAYEGDA